MEVLARISDIPLPGIPRTQRKACQRALTPARSPKLQQPGTLMRRELGRPVISFHSKTYPPEITRVATTVPFHLHRQRGAIGQTYVLAERQSNGWNVVGSRVTDHGIEGGHVIEMGGDQGDGIVQGNLVAGEEDATG